MSAGHSTEKVKQIGDWGGYAKAFFYIVMGKSHTKALEIKDVSFLRLNAFLVFQEFQNINLLCGNWNGECS